MYVMCYGEPASLKPLLYFNPTLSPKSYIGVLVTEKEYKLKRDWRKQKETENTNKTHKIRENFKYSKIKGKVRPCTGTEAPYRPYGS